MILMIFVSAVKIFLVTLTLLLLGLYFYFKKQYKYWDSKNVLHATPVFPFGNLTGIAGTAISVIFKKIYDESKHQRYYGAWLLHKPALMVNDPGNLFSLDGSEWKNLRAKISPIYSTGKLKVIFPLIVKCSRNLQDVLEESTKMIDLIDSKRITSSFIMDSILSTAFGIEIDCLKNPNNSIGKMMSKVLEPNLTTKLKFILALYAPDLAKLLKISIHSKEVQTYFLKMFRDLIDFKEKNNHSRNDVMDLLIRLLKMGYIDDVNSNDDEKNTIKQKFTFENLSSQAMTFLVAGHETAFRSMQFSLYELAKNQDVQSKLRKEIKEVLTRHKGEITYEAVTEMEYLGRVINETLRKYPPAAVLTRVCTNEFKDPNSNLIIDKDTMILIPVFGIHWDGRYYPDPEKFDPERFTKENQASRPNCTFLPFGEGPRICIGQRLALLEIKVGLVAILSKFQLQISENDSAAPIEFDPKNFLTSLKGEVMLKVSFPD